MVARKMTKFGKELDSMIKEYCGSDYMFCLDYGMLETTLYSWTHGRSELNLPKVALLAEYFADKSGLPPLHFAIRLVSNHDTMLTVQSNFNKKINKQRAKDRAKQRYQEQKDKGSK